MAITQDIEKCNEKIKKKLFKLNIKFPNSFWLTSLSEGNFANGYWIKYYKNFIKESILKKDLIKKESFVLNLIYYFRNFLKDFFLSIFIKKINKKIDKKKNLVYLNSSHIKKNKHGKIYNIYTDNIIEGDKKNLYLLTISRESKKNLISSFKIIKNFYYYKNYENIIFLESFFSPKNVFKNYILDIIKNFYISLKIINQLDIKDISPVILINDLAKQNTLFSLKNNINFNKTFQKINILFCPVFELVEGRVIVNLFNSIKIKTVGIVHGLPGKIHNLRLIKSLIKIPKASKPQIIFSTGKKINSEFIKNGFKNSFEIGYPRENKSIPNFNLSLIKKKKILVLLDMHFWKKTIHLTMHLKKYFELIYKPHPTNFKNVKYYLKGFGINVTNNLKFNKNDLFPEIIFCSDSGILYEFLKKKYFCYYLDTGLKNSFLFNSRKKNLFQIFNKKNIIYFKNLYISNNLKKYKVKLPNDICKHYGKKSVDEFKKVTKKLENKNFQYFEKN